jgi:methylated-DNA-[protein]-cysteine S-methyltransferase
MNMFFQTLKTPLGPLLVVVNDHDELVKLSFKVRKSPKGAIDNPTHTRVVAKQLGDYFSGKRRTFELKLNPTGTPFQKKVWAQLQRIPYGETRSYADIARAIGKPGASRAVGSANGANPIPIVIPCHRVINASGALGGYSGGLGIKKQLLSLESRQAA